MAIASPPSAQSLGDGAQRLLGSYYLRHGAAWIGDNWLWASCRRRRCHRGPLDRPGRLSEVAHPPHRRPIADDPVSVPMVPDPVAVDTLPTADKYLRNLPRRFDASRVDQLIASGLGTLANGPRSASRDGPGSRSTPAPSPFR